jgi:nucleotide-binding universal stress UspA family protein
MDARVYVVNAYVPPTLMLPDVAAAYAEAADQAADEAQRRLDHLIFGYRDARVPLEAVLRCGEPVDQVVNTAKQLHADLIVVGTHGRKGLARAVLGSVAESVVRNAPCAVLTVH